MSAAVTQTLETAQRLSVCTSCGGVWMWNCQHGCPGMCEYEYELWRNQSKDGIHEALAAKHARLRGLFDYLLFQFLHARSEH